MLYISFRLLQLIEYTIHMLLERKNHVINETDLLCNLLCKFYNKGQFEDA